MRWTVDLHWFLLIIWNNRRDHQFPLSQNSAAFLRSRYFSSPSSRISSFPPFRFELITSPSAICTVLTFSYVSVRLSSAFIIAWLPIPPSGFYPVFIQIVRFAIKTVFVTVGVPSIPMRTRPCREWFRHIRYTIYIRSLGTPLLSYQVPIDLHQRRGLFDCFRSLDTLQS